MRPAGAVMVLAQWWEAVFRAIGAVDEVCDLVDHHAGGVIWIESGLYIRPRKHQRAMRPGLAGAQIAHVVHHPVLIDLLVIDLEGIRVDHDRANPRQPVHPERESRQVRQRRDPQLHVIGELDRTAGVERPFGQKPTGQRPQALALLDRQHGKLRLPPADAFPGRGGYLDRLMGVSTEEAKKPTPDRQPGASAESAASIICSRVSGR